jgi:putative N6-adenine-specific DNA methylase
MANITLIAPCHFGLEAVLKREIQDLGYKITEVDDGRVTFTGDDHAVARSNIFLRTAERILLKVGEFRATTFDQLFEGTKALPWEDLLPNHAKFWVAKVSSVKSRLFSPSDIQAVMKKAMVERMRIYTGITWFPEDGPSYPLRVTIKKDLVTVALDTSGTSLHKRGYRVSPVIAPISETLAAALIKLSPWHPDRILVDPFCGSGTIPIEAAMMAKHIAPGAKRDFLAETWESLVARDSWMDARQEAKMGIKRDVETDIQGYDIDPRAVRFARKNAEAAGVEDLIHFQTRPVKELSHPKKYGFIITNPPYGERLQEQKELPDLYSQIGEAFDSLDSWSMYLITSYEDAERCIGRKADRNRKIYNGMLKTYCYQFLGPKPPRKSDLRG